MVKGFRRLCLQQRASGRLLDSELQHKSGLEDVASTRAILSAVFLTSVDISGHVEEAIDLKRSVVLNTFIKRKLQVMTNLLSSFGTRAAAQG